MAMGDGRRDAQHAAAANVVKGGEGEENAFARYVKNVQLSELSLSCAELSRVESSLGFSSEMPCEGYYYFIMSSLHCHTHSHTHTRTCLGLKPFYIE